MYKEKNGTLEYLALQMTPRVYNHLYQVLALDRLIKKDNLPRWLQPFLLNGTMKVEPEGFISLGNGISLPTGGWITYNEKLGLGGATEEAFQSLLEKKEWKELRYVEISRQIVVEAIQYKGNKSEIIEPVFGIESRTIEYCPDWLIAMREKGELNPNAFETINVGRYFNVQTVNKGDWFIKYPQDFIMIISDEQFQKDYNIYNG